MSSWWSESNANSDLTLVFTRFKATSTDTNLFQRLDVDRFFVAALTVKTNPPLDVRVISDKDSPTTLLLNWTPPIHKVYLRLDYEIRFCAKGSSSCCNASTFMCHLKRCNLIVSFKTSSVKHACLVSLRCLLQALPISLAYYRIFNQTQFTSLKFAVDVLMKACTGATGV